MRKETIQEVLLAASTKPLEVQSLWDFIQMKVNPPYPILFEQTMDDFEFDDQTIGLLDSCPRAKNPFVNGLTRPNSNTIIELLFEIGQESPATGSGENDTPDPFS